MHDVNGTELKVGDKVLIPGEITELQPGEEYCNVTAQMTLPRNPDGVKEMMTLNTACVVKTSEEAVGDLVDASTAAKADIDIIFLTLGSDHDLAIAAGKERGPGNARHSYAVLSQDGEQKLALIDFQKGPIKETGVNGVQNEQLLAIVADRLIGFQAGEFACPENQKALESVLLALSTLQMRTEIRKARGVEGQSVK